MVAINSKKKILVVDDDVEMTLMIEDILKNNDYDVILAHDGLLAIEKSNHEKVDLILLDIRMPFFSGFWFCDAFKQRPQTKDIPVVVVSALTTEEDVQKAFRMGACGYIKKPFRSEELLGTVKKALT
ncbi:MAG TPA: response regulator [Candidatus Omnitrophota bacterium]|nr:response regulator [Candidatus Omnitrophota bacterium]